MADAFFGDIRMFGFDFLPQGWAFCDGQTLSINQNQALFSILGTTYGGDGVSTFKLPDLRGRVPMNWGQGSGLSSRTLGESAGEATHTLTNSETPQHTHTVAASTAAPNQPGAGGGLWADTPDAYVAAPLDTAMPGNDTVNGGSIATNTCPVAGGGIGIGGNQNVNIGATTGVTISGNTVTGAGGQGGGVSITNTGALGVTVSTNIANSSIASNQANSTGSGGGVYFLSAYPATINATTISSNTATTGAGVFNGGSGNLLTINNGSQINSNTATGAGGGLRNEAANSTTTLDGMQFNTNTSGSGGDAIDMNNGTINLVGTVSLGDAESINLVAGTFTSTSGTLNLGGSLTRAAAATFTHNFGTVNFNGLGTQNINGTATSAAFNNLTVNKGSGIAQPSGSVTALTVAGNVLLTGNTLAVSSQSISLAGNWTNSGGSFNSGSGTVTFNGAPAQSIGGTTETVFNGLTINNAAGVTMTRNESATGPVTLTTGNLTVSSPNVFALGTLATTARTTGQVIGTMSKQFAAPGPLFVFPLGTTGQYSPLDVTVTAGAGTLTASATAAVSPVAPVPLGSGTTLHRYWTLSGSGITSNIVFHYLTADVFGNENAYQIIRVTGGTSARTYANNATTFVTPASDTFSVIGLSTYSDWTAGQPLAPTAAGASISGRVMTTDGRGIGRSTVVVTDQSETTRTAITNGFGYYAIDDLPTGQTYIVSVQNKLYAFAPRTISLGEDAAGFDLTAEP